MATRFTPFDIGDINERSLRDVDLVRSKLNEAVSAVRLRDQEIERLSNVATDLQKQSTQAERVADERGQELERVRKQLATEAAIVQQLNDRLKDLQAKQPRIGVQDLVGRFKTDIDRINADVLSRKTGGMLVDSVEVEVRGGIDVSDGLRITQLPPDALVAQSASVLKFNLRPTSVLKIVDDDEQPPPR